MSSLIEVETLAAKRFAELNPAYAAMAERRIASTQPGLQLA